MTATPIPLDATDEARAAGLRRMRLLALLLLVAMAGVFVATSYGQISYPWLGYVRAFAEAAMVGACADWFAVVALFRHPLGVPIPHTAIVPRNKQRIGGALGRFLTDHFFTPQVLKARLAELELSPWIAAWLANPDNARRLSRLVAAALPDILRTLPRQQITDTAKDWLERGLKALPGAPVAANLLAIVWAQGQTQKLVERSLELLEESVRQHKDEIRGKIEAGSSRWVPRWVDGMVAAKVMAAVTRTLGEMRDPAHPWRLELRQAVETLVERLQSDPELAARIDEAKAAMINDPLFHAQLEALWSEIEGRLPTDATIYAGHAAHLLERGLLALGRWLQDDPVLRTRFDLCARHLIKRTVALQREEIGGFVRRVVENWESDTLVTRIELLVGMDLQYIRINGTLVGGLVGLVIYTTSRWLLPG
ncbi:Uncharacterized membrane-anchored protein YjiN, DUF445 family [Enhydrobacter aerosaccus]|uniref:Uncharacterized membrane-anchored protein YjiN, DUF445 family n=1 Tax=Enhydrobacter aerosaccus TaxID=225324 RepID=A0A1T4LH20_9HYPH|nr:DUF445 domain-containing protein [Enhydrobacter aerosaccus]SJZ53898.1 Uncharacterized membrane-anchored protein YjiN, DUF445 family [Enhydrobacter aerosaccus]